MSDREYFQAQGFDLPPVPEGWVDISWKNDVCAMYLAPGPLAVWIDHPSAEAREFPECSRFSIDDCDDTGARLDHGHHFIDTDDWAEVLAFVESHPQHQGDQDA